MYDCGFTRENHWFRYRAAAIIVEDGCVLFTEDPKGRYFYSVGGGVQMGESARDAVVRKVLEETGVRYEVDHLAVIHESFFTEDRGALPELECHEICLYFAMKPRGTQQLDSRQPMCWLPIAELDQHKAFPTFMKGYLSSEHAGIQHIVTDERVKEPR